MSRCLRPRQCHLPYPQPGFSALSFIALRPNAASPLHMLPKRGKTTNKTHGRRQRGANRAERERREMEGRRMDPSGHKAAVFSPSGTGILIGMEVFWQIMSLHTTSSDSSTALAEPQHHFLPKKHIGNKKCIREVDTYLGCWMDSSCQALARRMDGWTDRQPGLAGSPRERGCGQRFMAVPSVTAAQLPAEHRGPNVPPSPGTSLPQDFPTRVITHR